MVSVDLSTSLMYLKGVGPARAAILETKGLRTVEDLLAYPPFRYEDRRNVKPIARLAPGEMATVIAEVRSARLARLGRRGFGFFEAMLSDGSRTALLGKWFHGEYLKSIIVPGQKIALYGKVEIDSYSPHLVMTHPEFELLPETEDTESALHVGRIVPIRPASFAC
jgi:ATP-dependent DNA helicase RecG